MEEKIIDIDILASTNSLNSRNYIFCSYGKTILLITLQILLCYLHGFD